MPLYTYESIDSMVGLGIIWSGGAPFFPSGLRLYADVFETYVTGQHDILSNTHAIKINTAAETREANYVVTNIDPPLDTRLGAMCHYLTEWGYAQASVMASIDTNTYESKLYSTIYPEYEGGWTQDAVNLPHQVVDIVFPDVPNSPRFIFGVKNTSEWTEDTSPNVVVILTGDTADGLGIRVNTNWSAMISGAVVTDLEAMRFI